MSIFQTRIEGSTRRFLVTAAVAGTAMAGALGVSTAAHAATNGIIVRQSCTGVSGQINYQPGLQSSKSQSVRAVLAATTTGCSSVFSGPQGGTGSFTAVLTGKASLAAENFTGTFTINWPASAGLNPSNGTLSVTDSNGFEVVRGTITSGALTGSPVGLTYLTTTSTGSGSKKHPVTAQAFVNSQPLQVTQNEG
jgi:hypothetical protein